MGSIFDEIHYNLNFLPVADAPNTKNTKNTKNRLRSRVEAERNECPCKMFMLLLDELNNWLLPEELEYISLSKTSIWGPFKYNIILLFWQYTASTSLHSMCQYP